jgi:hypothetical protein
MNIGDYCLATKYKDGEGRDAWAVGFYVGEIFPRRHQVSDQDGKTWRANGFRRCEPITREQGDFLITRKEWIEQVGFKLWDYIHPPKDIKTVKPKSLKMNLRIVANDIVGIKSALRQIANGKLSSNEYATILGVAEYDYDFVRSNYVFSKDGKKKVVDPNKTDKTAKRRSIVSSTPR